ncbi:MAG TPA: ABC transporter ATP-binding protein, partial [Pyrinomonadaceae bacterium]|nr:ABC transporter ATP-binding protein [Pyrinomonadaceae bacterium]
MKPIIRVQGLSKRYQIGSREAEHGWMRNAMRAVSSPFRTSALRDADSDGASIWALRDVSFDVKPGEVVGFIGRNGAGKSTLLKILSRITKPTRGRVELYGRVGSLLELGTGFHPELTGRENIYLNGALLGMARGEIDRKFDEIVAFAEIDKFLDTPIKHYSSGMYMRLAFAVAAHLEPEILIVDEVLAVGDAAFQRKCLGKMDEVRQEGRTVLFVSHQLSAVEKICSRAFVIRSGRFTFDGPTEEAIKHYLSDLDATVQDCDLATVRRSGSGELRLIGFSIEDSAGTPAPIIFSGEDAVFVLDYEAANEVDLRDLSVRLFITTPRGDTLTVLNSDNAGVTFSDVPSTGQFRCRVKDLPYSTG